MIALVFALMCAAAQPENLLANSGFEDVAGGRPLDWEVYVKPMEGAYAEADPAHSHGGRFSAMIHVPAPYLQEPANNWSQNVLDPDLAGKTVLLEGAIRTEGQPDAAIWVQCWQRQPWRALRTESTRGTGRRADEKGWREVSVLMEVPARTDYVTVRCVMQGAGTAWFDDVSLRIVPDEDDAPDEADTAATAPPETTVDLLDAPPVADVLEELEQDAPGAGGEDTAPPEAARPQRQADDAEAQRRVLEELMEAQAELRAANADLREANAALADRVEALRQELAALREAIGPPEPTGQPKTPAAEGPPPWPQAYTWHGDE